MKPSRLLVISVLIWIYPCASMTALAEIKPNTFNLTPLIGGYVFEGDQDLENGSLFGLGFGYDFDKHWGAEVQFNYVDTEADSSGEGVDGYLYRLDGLYHFMPENKPVPYVAAGLGGLTLDLDKAVNDTSFIINYDGGIKYFLTDDIALRGDIRHVISFDDIYHNLIYTL